MLDDIPWGLEGDETGAYSKLPYVPFYVDGENPIVIDEEDFLWTCQWRWQWNPSKNKKKLYVRRTSTYQGRDISVYLHKAICLRAHGMPPTASHIIADHKNGNTLDCRRHNLRWATPSENRQNYNGIYALQVRMDLGIDKKRLLRAHIFGGLRGLSAAAQRTSDPWGLPHVPAGGPQALSSP